MTLLIIFVCVVAGILLLGMIADSDAENRKNFTYAFCTCLLALTMILGIIYM